MIASRSAAAVLIVVALAGCSGPGGGGPAAPADPGVPDVIDPWIGDDLETDSAVISGDYEGLSLVGFSCDVAQYLGAGSDLDAVPYATVVVTTATSGITYRDAGGISDAVGPSVLPGAGQTSVSVAGEGYFHIGDGGQNTPWSASVDLTLTPVPVPEDGCTAADLWAVDLMDVGTDAAELARALSEDGLTNVATECPDAWFTWIPPHLTCEEFEERVG